MSFDHLQSIYRNFDIRGAYPDEINETEVKKIGQSLVFLHQAKKVVIGHDYRPSSESLHEALIAGITAAGADVVTVGMITTPMLYHAAGEKSADVSIMITGSHMPTGFNGLKICLADVVPIGLDSGLAELRDHVAADFHSDSLSVGAVTEYNVKPDWQEHVAALLQFNTDKTTKVVIDPANMVGILEIDTVRQFESLEVTSMYDEYDWSCPHHEANPMKLDTLKDLGDRVVSEGAAIGIGLDGDADRIGVVDENGIPVPQDVVGALIAKELITRNGGTGKVIHDVRSSKHAGEVIEAAGGEAVPHKIGHTYIRRLMRENGALYGLELSGHHFFRDMHNSEGGIFPALLLIEIMQKENKTLSELAAAHQVYYHSSEINSEVERTPEAIYEHLRSEFTDAEFETIDGLTIKYDDWWCNVRPSANDPVMRLNLEADTKTLMEEKRDFVLSIIRNQ